MTSQDQTGCDHRWRHGPWPTYCALCGYTPPDMPKTIYGWTCGNCGQITLEHDNGKPARCGGCPDTNWWQRVPVHGAWFLRSSLRAAFDRGDELARLLDQRYKRAATEQDRIAVRAHARARRLAEKKLRGDR